MFQKIVRVIKQQSSERGLYISFLMNLAQLLGMIRAIFYKLIYIKNLEASIFTMESHSRFEIFNKRAKVEVGKFVFIRRNCRFRVDFSGNLQLGDYVFINDNCNINCVDHVSIGDYTKIAPNVCINDHDHNYKKKGDQHLLKSPVTIGKNVWIGSNVVILRGAVIGDNAVIAAGSVVRGTVPSHTVYYNKRTDEFIAYMQKEKLDGGN